jgi:integrase
MPLKLYPPRPPKNASWTIRGTHFGVRVNRGSGARTRALAEKVRRKLERDIESGALAPEKGTGFAAAAAAYMKAGGDARFLRPLIQYFANAPLNQIDQVQIDNAAGLIYPNANAATRNRQVYTPMIAVLRRAGVGTIFKRPKGWMSPKSVSWLEPEHAFALFAAADKTDAEFGLFLRRLCYTGMRRSEALSVTLAQVDLDGQRIYLPKTKNSNARRVYLTPELVVTLANHPRALDRDPTERLFRFHAGSYLHQLLARSMQAAALSFPPRQRGFHLFRHTWATWMRRYGGLDTSGLLETGAWRSRTSASRYEHLDATEEARKADLLPTLRTK